MVKNLEVLELLKKLIQTPSLSREEKGTADLIQDFLQRKGFVQLRSANNIIAFNKAYKEGKPTILLNSHHDTVAANSGYTVDPFGAIDRDGRIIGLGSNDAGASLVSLLACFLHYAELNLKYNLVFAATAEEEISGSNGIELALKSMPPIEFAIVGEPTGMEMAIAERGLLVIDCVAQGKAGHAAREEGENAIYKALRDIEILRELKFERVSPFLQSVKLSVTSIQTVNKAHNVVPEQCSFIVDVRVNENYKLEEVFEVIASSVDSACTARSMRLRSSIISPEHPLVKSGIALGKRTYGSPTSSDKGLMPFPALKMGPGDSARSHTADEFIYINEIHSAIEDYINLLHPILL